MKLTNDDIKQIKNLILWFFENKKYFPFADELINNYKIFFPNKVDNNTKEKFDKITNEVITE